MSELNANSVQPDQTLHSAVSDLGVYCLSMSFLWDARLKWVKPHKSFMVDNSKAVLLLQFSSFVSLFVLRFYGPVTTMGSCRAWSVYPTSLLLGRLGLLSG